MKARIRTNTSDGKRAFFWLKISLILAVVAFFSFIVVRLLNTDQTINVVLKYNLPSFENIEKIQGITNLRYAVSIDGDIVYANDNDPHPTASTAKMILGLAIMDKKPLTLGETGEMITIDERFFNLYTWYVNNGGSNSKVAIGEQISEYDALASIFLPSSNNMADTLAIWGFGSIDAYREYATEMLKKYGITDTTIGADASGFNETTKSTVSDLAKIGAKVLENPVLSEIVGLKSHNVPVAGLLENTNQLLGENGIVGVKTGYIGTPSGYCLVTGYRVGDHIVTVALTGAETRNDSFDSSLHIVQQAQEMLKETVIVMAEQEIGYYDSWWQKTSIVSTEEMKGVGWEGAKTDTNLEMDRENGTLSVSIGSKKYQINVSAHGLKTEPDFWQKLLHVFGWKAE